VDERHPGGILPFENDQAQKEVFNILWGQSVPPKQREYFARLRDEGSVRVADGYVDAGRPDKPAGSKVNKD
jgi:hypothetical protein